MGWEKKDAMEGQGTEVGSESVRRIVEKWADGAKCSDLL